MRAEDIDAVARVLERVRPDVKRAIMTSGSSEEEGLLRRMWPHVAISNLSESDWDLDGPHPMALMGIDLVVACNTFMCSRDPGRWLDNLAQTSRLVMIQDLAVAQRRQDRHLSLETGDVMRYSLTTHGIIGKTDEGHMVFDLSSSGYRVIDCDGYRVDDGRGLKFAALIDLSRKVQR